MYPPLDPTSEEMARAARKQPDPPAFRLQKINELEALLRSEIESRGRLHKKYHRAAKMLDCSFGCLSGTGLGMDSGGLAMMFTGFGLGPGVILEGAGLFVSALEVVSIFISRKCSAKAVKHSTIQTLAMAKLDTIRSHVQKAMENDVVTNYEYKLICEEVEKYRNLKEESRRKHTASVIDEQAKKELIERGRSEALVSLMEKLTGASKFPST